MKKNLIIAIFFLLFVNPSYASTKSVLGSDTVNIPPTVDGPGIFLPDSPLFFLDELKQKTRLILAVTSEQKAKAFEDIAGERMAELRFMITRNNEAGIRVDLMGISDNFKKAAEQLEFAKMSGRNVSLLAKEINDNIKEKVAILDGLERETTAPEMAAQIRATSEGLMSAKVKAEDNLNEADLQNEIRDDLDRATTIDLKDVRDTSADLKISLVELQRQASEAAKTSLKKREAALLKAIAEKNISFQKEQEKLLQREKESNKKILSLQKRTLEEIEEAKAKIEEAVKKFEELRSR